MSNDFATQIAAIRQRFQQHEAAMLAASRDDLDQIGDEAKVYMQANAPWTDQSGDARAGLDYVPLHPAQLTDGGRVMLVGREPHNKWLEVANDKAYNIVLSAWVRFGTRLYGKLKERWR
jgi:hypothetical protein